MALRPHENITKEFCFYLTLHLSEKMKQSATGLIEGIDRKTVLNQRAFLPPIIEQERIVKFLSEIEKALITQEGVLKSLVSIKKGIDATAFYIKSCCKKETRIPTNRRSVLSAFAIFLFSVSNSFDKCFCSSTDGKHRRMRTNWE